MGSATSSRNPWFNMVQIDSSRNAKLIFENDLYLDDKILQLVMILTVAYVLILFRKCGNLKGKVSTVIIPQKE